MASRPRDGAVDERSPYPADAVAGGRGLPRGQGHPVGVSGLPARGGPTDDDEVAAWEEPRNKACRKVVWHFTTVDAR